MVIRFENSEAAAGWRSSAAHQSLQPKIKALYNESKLQIYDVIA
jgi:antibiotic biosynthesis monooxygenase (ABM) superfamily enzyme